MHTTRKNTLQSAQLNAELQRAAALLNKGRLKEAQSALAKLIELAPNHPSALYLLGALRKREGDLAAAHALYTQSLSIHEPQAMVHNALAGVLTAQNRKAEAVLAYARAVDLEPRYLEAWLNLGRVQMELGSVEESKAAFRQALKLSPNSASAHFGLARALEHEEHWTEAVHECDRALAAKPDHVLASVLRARCLTRLGDPHGALAGLNVTLQAVPNSADVLAESGRVAFATGDALLAVDRLRAALSHRPTDINLHRDLNQVLYMTKDATFLSSYRHVLAQQPDNPAMLSAYAFAAAAADRADEAKPAIDAAISRGAADPQIFSAAARLNSAQHQFDAALEWARKAAEAAPSTKSLVQNHCEAALAAGALEEARSCADQAMKLDPMDQLSLAYWVTVLRAGGDDRADGLYDAKKFTEKRQIDVPEGYASLAEFNADLVRELTQLHHTQREPLDQSLRGGTQVQLTGFDRSNRVIGLLVAALKENVARFARGLPDDDNHPFIKRKPQSIEFSGIWSVRLSNGGSHVSHVHPEGWLSSCYYVDLPDVVAHSDDHQGWLKIGEPPMANLAKIAPATLIQPEAGSLALFPSFYWHGTVPFRSDQPRLTVAFDVKPGEIGAR